MSSVVKFKMKVEWNKHKQEITEDLKAWNEVHEKAVKEEMTKSWNIRQR